MINFEIPNVPETYVHRIGRTGRAGLGGVALSLCDTEEKAYIRDINKLISKSIPVIDNHPYVLTKFSENNPKRQINQLDSAKTKNNKTGGATSWKPRRRKTSASKVWTNR